MAVPYYDQTKVKLDINETTSDLDAQLVNWNDEAESEINDMLWDVAHKSRLVSALPVLPFTTGSVPETIQGAADHYVKARFYEFTKNNDLMEMHEKKWKQKIRFYITRLEVSKEIYGRIAR